jgi:diguanylate cyclase (GGDEF)-like protein/putative nucleotidyltransferase with HDIG domain
VHGHALTAARAALLLGALLSVAYALHGLVGLGGAGMDALFDWGVYNAALCLAAVVMVARGIIVRRERWAWIGLGLGLLSWTAANNYYDLFVADLDPAPSPSVADGLWLAFYPPAYLAIILIVRSRLSGLRRGLWLDGVIGALAAGALCAALTAPLLPRDSAAPLAAIATNMAYPIGDLVLAGVITFALAVNGRRGGTTWSLLGAGFVIFAAFDGLYLWEVASGRFDYASLIDVGWLVAGLLFAAAALSPPPERRESLRDGQNMIVVPCGFGLVGLGLLVYGNLASIHRLALALATLCVLAVIVRMAVTFAQNRREALTDALTGLPNRRRLARDLRERASAARPERPLGLVVFDLNGFKRYNDAFGHPAGDALLVRLSRSLAAAVGPSGVAYRMGGDEFCVLLDGAAVSLDESVSRALAALTEVGEGFSIDAAYGLVSIPVDESDAERALGLADQRMYALKRSGRVPTERQTSDALLQVLSERDPGLGDHSDGVAELARATARRMGLGEADLEEVVIAARLHDIGKAAVPDAILMKPGPLSEDEREIMKRHPAIGERILRAAPSLQGVARIVRSSHEWVDGSGYPDRLAGGRIPLGARIVAVCDAFDAIISDRPYSAARTPEQAADELRRCAGSQFDRDVVEAFVDVLAERARQPEGISLS